MRGSAAPDGGYLDVQVSRARGGPLGYTRRNAPGRHPDRTSGLLLCPTRYYPNEVERESVRKRLRRYQERRNGLVVAASIGASLALAAVLVAKWDELESAVTGASLAVIALTAALQVLALVSRSEAWLACVRASGGSVSRRRLYRASGMGGIGSQLNSQLGTAARIAVLRRSAPRESPCVPALIAAELPILVVEAALAAIASVTLIGPLGLPWWFPIAAVATVTAVGVGLRSRAVAKIRWLGQGLAVARTARGGARVVAFVLVAVFSQIARNWLLLHAVGVDASVFDATAVLIAVVTLGQLPFGLSVGAAASVLILGPQGVAAAAAAGVLLTATGTMGSLCFATWAGLDLVLGEGRAARFASSWRHSLRPAGAGPWAALGALPAPHRLSIERSYFGGLSHLQITRVLGVV
jgi:hypothetical protein